MLFLPYRDVPASDADRSWVRRQLNQLALEHHLPHDAYARFRAAIDRATLRSEVGTVGRPAHLPGFISIGTMTSTDFILRPATEADRTYLARLLYLTDVFGDETAQYSETLAEDLAVYVGAWNPDQGGLIALSPQGVPAGGVWLRAGVEKRPVYGFVESDVPELAIAVENRFSGRGLGRWLIQEMLEQAREAGHPAVSLAVDAGNNRARRLYLKLGFEVVKTSAEGGETMIYRF